jgi:hypothetical protein
VELHDALREREAQPCSFGARARIAAATLERLEDALLLVLGDTDAGVADLDLRPLSLDSRGDMD